MKPVGVCAVCSRREQRKQRRAQRKRGSKAAKEQKEADKRLRTAADGGEAKLVGRKSATEELAKAKLVGAAPCATSCACIAMCYVACMHRAMLYRASPADCFVNPWRNDSQ